MNASDIDIVIDELILDGFPAGDYAQAAAALSSELVRLIRERGVPQALLRADSSTVRPGAAVNLVPGQTVEQAFVAAARSIYSNWGNQGSWSGSGDRAGSLDGDSGSGQAPQTESAGEKR